jgi:uncharacterized coiled-coil protein SlyX
MSVKEELKDNVEMLTKTIADQTTTLNALYEGLNILNERIKKLEIKVEINNALNSQINE